MESASRLREIARAIVANSTSPVAAGFDADAWLQRWLDVPQAALGMRKPADLLGTAEGLDAVVRVLGSIESGSYQ